MLSWDLLYQLNRILIKIAVNGTNCAIDSYFIIKNANRKSIKNSDMYVSILVNLCKLFLLTSLCSRAVIIKSIEMLPRYILSFLSRRKNGASTVIRNKKIFSIKTCTAGIYEYEIHL